MIITSQNKTLNLDTPKIMGILNVTPDSFSDGGRWNDPQKALMHAKTMLEDGASIIDIGGESTRPGAAAVSVDEEMDRVIPAVETIAQNLDVMISVDTSQPKVMEEACKAGAHIWNDVRALKVEGALNKASELGIPVILMHMKGNPLTMQVDPNYDDVVAEVKTFLLNRADEALKAGIKKENIILDLGFGFGKNMQHNFRLLGAMAEFVELGYPVLSALSRKTMIGQACGIDKPEERVIGSVAGALLSVERGAQLLRVHDVKETAQALKVYMALQESMA